MHAWPVLFHHLMNRKPFAGARAGASHRLSLGAVHHNCRRHRNASVTVVSQGTVRGPSPQESSGASPCPAPLVMPRNVNAHCSPGSRAGASQHAGSAQEKLKQTAEGVYESAKRATEDVTRSAQEAAGKT